MELNRYKIVRIPKNGRRGPLKEEDYRTLHIPDDDLKLSQRAALWNEYKNDIGPGPYAHGFVKKRDPMTHAMAHVGRRFVVRLDIKDFFPSIGLGAVESVFRPFGYKPDVVNLLSRLTLLNGKLPQGAPTSPYLANLVFFTQR